MTTTRAFRIYNENGRHRAGIGTVTLEEPAEGEILIQTLYSSVNYKDALAGTGKGKILRHFPLTGGIDGCGVVVQSNDDRFNEGDQVLVTGWGMSVTHDGGYSEWIKVPGDWAVAIPGGLSPSEAMALGTAGFTAALALHRMEINGQTPEMGPVVVTGASGGVGTIAVDILSSLGYEVVAVSGKKDQWDFLSLLGAETVMGREDLPVGRHPLEKGLWGGVVDSVGGEMLAGLARFVKPWGNIASIGLAGGHELNTTVMPFIIRGVSLLGINSQDCPRDLRVELWERLATDMKPRHLDEIADRTIQMEDLEAVFEEMLAGKTKGRILVQTGSEGD